MESIIFKVIGTHIIPKITETLVDTENLTVEHILSQKGGRSNTEDDWKECVDLVGNLAMASKEINLSMSCKLWGHKKKALHKYSRLHFNKTLLKTVWKYGTKWRLRAIVLQPTENQRMMKPSKFG